ncbi:MAG TPA: beta-propeller fold lactonase family protein [Terriglobales bacterium]|nr:beta-propeller fold lactonase family protein [Terriglobales bacterium]
MQSGLTSGTQEKKLFHRLRRFAAILTAFAIAGLLGCGSSTLNSISSTDTMYVAARGSAQVFGYRANFNTGELTTINGSPFAAQQAPSAIVIDPSHAFAYVANAGSNTVESYSFDLNGSMIKVATQSVGITPVALAMDSAGKFLFVANQGSNSISVFTIGSGGSMTPVATGTCAASPASCFLVNHPAALAITPSTNFLFVADQVDNVVVTFQVDPATGLLSPNRQLPPVGVGASPSGLAMDSGGNFLFVANHGSNDLSAFTVASSNSLLPGNLTSIAGSPFATGLGPAGAAVDPSGQFLYVTDQNSNEVSGFRIRAVSGLLSKLSASPYSTGVAPVAVSISPTNKFLYVANSGSASISAYSIDPPSGNLIPASGAVPTGPVPAAIAFGR